MFKPQFVVWTEYQELSRNCVILLDYCYEKGTIFHVFYTRNAHNLCRFCISVCRFRENDAVTATSNWQHYIEFWRTYLGASMSGRKNRIEYSMFLFTCIDYTLHHQCHVPLLSLQFHWHVTAMSLPCHCHVTDMSCHVTVMSRHDTVISLRHTTAS